MIYLLTGQPGHGKTLRALQLARKFVADGRTVYAGRIRGLNYEKAGFQVLEDFKAWMDLPDGSVVLLDECYIDMPKRASGRAVPPWVDELARHRHRGFDFIFVCQSPTKQLDPFVHDLVEDHTHVRRKFGFNVANLSIWDKFQSNVKADALRTIRWFYPKELFGLYQSTEMDTSEKRVPWYMWGAPAALLLVLLSGWLYTNHWKNKAAEIQGTAGAEDPVSGGQAGRGTRPERTTRPYATPEEYRQFTHPRIDAVAWSAPAFDGRQVKSDPHVYCMAGGRGRQADGSVAEESCSCMTEQGTPHVVARRTCLLLARVGEPYNPFKEPVQVAQSETRDSGVQGPAPAAMAAPVAAPAPSAGEVGAATGQAGYGAQGSP